MNRFNPGISRFVQLAQLPVLLQVEPEAWTLTEQPAWPHRHVGRHASPAAADVANLGLRHAQALGDQGLGDLILIENLLQDLTLNARPSTSRPASGTGWKYTNGHSIIPLRLTDS